MIIKYNYWKSQVKRLIGHSSGTLTRTCQVQEVQTQITSSLFVSIIPTRTVVLSVCLLWYFFFNWSQSNSSELRYLFFQRALLGGLLTYERGREIKEKQSWWRVTGKAETLHSISVLIERKLDRHLANGKGNCPRLGYGGMVCGMQPLTHSLDPPTQTQLMK